MTSPAQKFMTAKAREDRTARLRVVAKTVVPQDDLSRAKRALWTVEERFKNIIRRNAQVRCNSARLDHAVSEAFAGLAAVRSFFEGH